MSSRDELGLLSRCFHASESLPPNTQQRPDLHS